MRLIADGVSNSEACRLVGLNRKTGTRWRYGRSIPGGESGVLFYPPVTVPERPDLSPRYVSEVERAMICDLHWAGETVRAIAAQLGRWPSTISRELLPSLDQPPGRRHRHGPWLVHEQSGLGGRLERLGRARGVLELDRRRTWLVRSDRCRCAGRPAGGPPSQDVDPWSGVKWSNIKWSNYWSNPAAYAFERTRTISDSKRALTCDYAV